jgi:hypothetical protein
MSVQLATADIRRLVSPQAKRKILPTQMLA